MVSNTPRTAHAEIETYRKTTPSENLMVIRARLSEHLSPAEKRELEEAASTLAAAQADAERFIWWFGVSDKTEFIERSYFKGIGENWTLDQWRSAIDAARKEGK